MRSRWLFRHIVRGNYWFLLYKYRRVCNFLIAVSVTAKMESHFAHNTPETPKLSMKRPSTIQTILRSFLVQNHNLNSFGAEFMRSEEMAAVGERAALEQVPKIKQLLARLDPHLFPLPAESIAE